MLSKKEINHASQGADVGSRKKELQIDQSQSSLQYKSVKAEKQTTWAHKYKNLLPNQQYEINNTSAVFKS